MSSGIQHIQNLFEKHKAFVGYLTAGDGGIKRTLDAALALIEGGVNMLEIGVPFSDPIADGPVIQRAAARSLALGTTLADILWLVRAIRQHSTIPLVLFTYFNPILLALRGDFFQQAKEAGIDGILVVDCPLEESHSFRAECLAYQMAPIYVIAPTTSIERIQTIDKVGQGFLYYACRKGTTGVQTELPEDFSHKIRLIKANTHLPVITGFGISTQAMAQKVLVEADGVVVGSLFVKGLEEGMSLRALAELADRINPLKK